MTPGGADIETLAALDRVREQVLIRADLTAALAGERESAAFAARLAGIADALGVGLTTEAILALLALPPMGLRALALPLRSCADGAPPDWRPGVVDLMTGAVQWVHLGGARADGGFYYDEVQRALRRPFNRLFRFASPLAELAGAPDPDGLSPSGVIFHMSFCGSTLVSRMLATADASLSLGEPQPLDAALRLCAAGRLDEIAQVQLLRGVAAALGRPRQGETRYFLKLDAWHIGLIPLIRRAFPAAPWIFLYREPLAVLQAQVLHNGLDPARMPLGPLGIEWNGARPGARFYAAALAAICETALDAVAEHDGGLLASYAELPAAVGARILPHFGAQPAPADLDAMARVARQHAKTPGRAFVPDSDAKRAAASPETRAAVDGRLADAWARLEAARQAG